MQVLSQLNLLTNRYIHLISFLAYRLFNDVSNSAVVIYIFFLFPPDKSDQEFINFIDILNKFLLLLILLYCFSVFSYTLGLFYLHLFIFDFYGGTLDLLNFSLLF